MDQLDRYYTPIDIAARIILDHVKVPPDVCVDTTCGTGNLLAAVSSMHNQTECIGLDKDVDAITKLRENRPDWHLLATDIFHENTTQLLENLPIKSCDLLLINPPFTMDKVKSFEVQYQGVSFKSSLAMAHILRSFDLFESPKEALIIAPESMMYSERDFLAREALGESYTISNLYPLERKAFTGAFVGSTVLKISKNKPVKELKYISGKYKTTIKVKVMRGGLPVHEHRFDSQGMPYVHTTNFKELWQGNSADLKLVTSISRGTIQGNVIFIPRVGIPKIDYFKTINLLTKVQLSDCVIAFQSTSKQSLKTLEARVLENWNQFIDLYKGTGARYISISRLESWLKDELNVHILK
jgi:16S rRNA G966 N2-methylase RsmD